MLEYLRELFKGKGGKVMLNIAAAFAVGVILLISSNAALFTRRSPEPMAAVEPAAESGDDEKLESRLAEILSRVEGAGEVRVMITMSYGRELVLAEDGKYDKTVTEETDAQGGRRMVESLNTSGTKIMIKDGDGSVSPLVLKTIEPKVEGVIVVAGGGDNAVIKEQLIRATQTVLGVEPHKVQVLKSKTR